MNICIINHNNMSIVSDFSKISNGFLSHLPSTMFITTSRYNWQQEISISHQTGWFIGIPMVQVSSQSLLKPSGIKPYKTTLQSTNQYQLTIIYDLPPQCLVMRINHTQAIWSYDQTSCCHGSMRSRNPWVFLCPRNLKIDTNGTWSGKEIPIGSMYAIYANIGGIWMVNVTIYSIHGSYGIWPRSTIPITMKWVFTI